MNVLFQAFITSDFFGKLIFIGLSILSVITWLVLLQKFFQYRTVRKEANKLQLFVVKAGNNILSIDSSKIDSGENEKEGLNPFLAIFNSIKEKTVEILDKNHFFISRNSTGKHDSVFLSTADLEHLEATAQITLSNEAKRLEKNLYLLSTIAPLAPFVGLLGTVWGILISLNEMQREATTHANSAVLSGLTTALATTVIGLLIAIPALIAYNYLRNQLKDVCTEMEDFSSILLSSIELQYRRVDIP